MTDRVAKRPVFVVGCPRSGTTLVEVMLDSHSGLRVFDELSLIAGLAPRRTRPWARPASVEDVIAHRRFRRLGISPDVARAAVAAAGPSTYEGLIDAVMTAAARAHGKRRWGEKMPGYVSVAPLLARHLPDAQFVHVIRDGREVAAALAAREWGPPSAVMGAFFWRRKVAPRRALRRRLGPGRYYELRLERLTADPDAELRRVCEFLGEEYEASMLEYHLEYRDRELRTWRAHLAKPPTPGLREWTTGLSRREQRAVESVCAPLLRSLGYAEPRRSAGALAYAGVIGLRDLARMLPHAVRNRIGPRRRVF